MLILWPSGHQSAWELSWGASQARSRAVDLTGARGRIPTSWPSHPDHEADSAKHLHMVFKPPGGAESLPGTIRWAKVLYSLEPWWGYFQQPF